MAVVGSGGGLRGSGLGAKIDASDVQIRFNGAPSGGPYAADVGRRTTIRLATSSPWRQARRAQARFGGLTLYAHTGWVGAALLRDALSARPLGPGSQPLKSKGRGGAEAVAVANPVLVARVSDLLRSIGNTHLANGRARIDAGEKRVGSPTSGMVGVAMALALCGPGRVDVYGFGNASDAKAAHQCDHYWECRTSQAA